MSAAELMKQSGRTALGVSVGSLSALIELVFLIVAGPLLLGGKALPGLRRPVYRCARQLTRFELWRLRRYLGRDDVRTYTDRGAVSYLAVRWLVGLLGAVVMLLLLLGLTVAVSMISAWITGGSWGYIEEGDDRVTHKVLLSASIPGVVLLYLDVMGLLGVADLEAFIATRYLGPSANDLLRRRVSELSASRAEVVQAVNDERRRIERDLHDGVQQRLVALGLLLSRARHSKDPAKAADLVRQAHEESEQALHDLRDVAWRVYPTVLDQLGLHDVLVDVADRAGIPVTLRYELDGRPPASTETVAYFVIAEAVSNAVKHSGADRVEITVTGNSSTRATYGLTSSAAVTAANSSTTTQTSAPAIVGAVSTPAGTTSPGSQPGPGTNSPPHGPAPSGSAVPTSGTDHPDHADDTGPANSTGDKGRTDRVGGRGGKNGGESAIARLNSITVTVVDNGRGGADPAGRGLTGLAGRVAATDGRFSVTSPLGGPTTVRAELPCG
ncbi:sensor histidine kinase [Kribbella deserti]|uniref:histidine kinase n=1 Tax=Kribbella deserti TaxID=1926257 RepID=A0ABV6QWG2_9ACTN